MTYTEAIAALATALGCANDETAVAAALRATHTDLKWPRGGEFHKMLKLVESHIHKRAGAEHQVAYLAPGLIELVMRFCLPPS